jgi:hypothetical protein
MMEEHCTALREVNSLAAPHRAKEELNGKAERAARCLLI